MDTETMTAAPKRRGRPKKPQIKLVVPTARETQGYQVRRLDCSLDARQRQALRIIYDGLLVEGETLAGGKRIDRTQDAVRWLLDQAADALGL